MQRDIVKLLRSSPTLTASQLNSAADEIVQLRAILKSRNEQIESLRKDLVNLSKKGE